MSQGCARHTSQNALAKNKIKIKIKNYYYLSTAISWVVLAPRVGISCNVTHLKKEWISTNLIWCTQFYKDIISIKILWTKKKKKWHSLTREGEKERDGRTKTKTKRGKKKWTQSACADKINKIKVWMISTKRTWKTREEVHAMSLVSQRCVGGGGMGA